MPILVKKALKAYKRQEKSPQIKSKSSLFYPKLFYLNKSTDGFFMSKIFLTLNPIIGWYCG